MSARTYRALVIANSTFPNDSQNLIELEGPRNDPALLRDALCDRATGLFANDNVRLTLERTMAEVLRELEDFLRSASRQDTVLLYYSGHGMLDQSGELYLCTRDSRIDRLRSTAVKASDIRGMMDDSSAASTVVVLDCCHSGRFKSGGDVSAALSGRGRFVITSSRSGELANDAHARNHASLFTHHLVEGLLAGAPDHDGDGIVTLSEIYDYIHGRLGEEGKQVPQKRFEGDGDVPMALRTAVAADEPPPNPQPDLLDPALVAPVLDISETNLDLGEIDADEELPPERIAVINRGGGSLKWTVECSAPWVTPEVEERVLVLHLQPQPGPNRANVYIVDSLTGAQRTVRVSVRVRAATAQPAPESGPVPEPEPPPEPEPVPDPDPDEAPSAIESRPLDEATTAAVTTADADELVPAEELVAVVEALSPSGLDSVDDLADLDRAGDLADREARARHDEGADVAPTPGPTVLDLGDSLRSITRVLTRLAPVLLVVLGVGFVLLGLGLYSAVQDYAAKGLLFRNDDFPSYPTVPGVLPVVVAGTALAVAGLASLVRTLGQLTVPAGSVLVIAAGLATTTEVLSLTAQEHEIRAGTGWIVLWMLLGIVVGLAWPVSTLLAPAPSDHLPRALVAVAAVSAIAWGLGSAAKGYDVDGKVFGSMSDGGGGVTHLLLVLVTVAAVALALRSESRSGAGLLLGASVVPASVAVAEIVFSYSTVYTYGETGGQPWLVAVPAAVLLGAAIWSVATTRGAPKDNSIPGATTAG